MNRILLVLLLIMLSAGAVSAQLTCSFIIDLRPPYLMDVFPPPDTVMEDTSFTVSFTLHDDGAGVIPANDTVYVIVDTGGVPDTTQYYGTESVPLEVPFGAEVTVCVIANDDIPDLGCSCPPNRLDSCWAFSTPCETLDVVRNCPDISPIYTSCQYQWVDYLLLSGGIARPQDFAAVVTVRNDGFISEDTIRYPDSRLHTDLDTVRILAPAAGWNNGDTVMVILFPNLRCPTFAPDTMVFYVDRQEPFVVAGSVTPPDGSVIPTSIVDISFDMLDSMAGVWTDSIQVDITVQHIGGAVDHYYLYGRTDTTMEFSNGDSVTVCVTSAIDYIIFDPGCTCQPNGLSEPYCWDFSVLFCDVLPFATVIYPDSCGYITSCDDQYVIFSVQDTSEFDVVDTSFTVGLLVRNNGIVRDTTFDIDYPGLFWDAATGELRFDPSGFLWGSGDTVTVTLQNAVNTIGCPLEAVVSCMFIVDLEPPYLAGITPSPGYVFNTSDATVSFDIVDDIAGVNTDSTRIFVHIWGHGGESFDTLTASPVPLVLSDGDSIEICVRTVDIPDYDYCAPNGSTYCFIYTAAIGEVSAIVIEPIDLNSDGFVVVSCTCQVIAFEISSEYGIVPESTVVEVEGVPYGWESGNLSFSSGYDTLVFTPSPPCFADSEFVDFALLNLVDSTGSGLTGSVTGSFLVDLTPPYFYGEYPPDGSSIYSTTADIHVNVDDRVWREDSTSFQMAVYVNGSLVETIDSLNYSGFGPLSDGDSVRVCVTASDIVDPYCPPNRLDSCWTFYVLIGEISASVLEPIDLNGDGNIISACTCQTIAFEIASEHGILPESTIVEVNGVPYDWGSGNLSFSSGYDTLVFTPSPPCFADSEVVEYSLVQLFDSTGTPLPEAVSGSFLVDLTPPVFSGEHPPDGFIVSTHSVDIDVSVCDSVSYVDSISIGMMVVVGSDTATFDTVSVSGFSDYDDGDTVYVCVWGADNPDYCDANIDTFCWEFYVSFLCSLSVDAGTDRFSCPGDSVMLSATASGVTGDVFYRWSSSCDAYISDSTSASPYVMPDSSCEFYLFAIDSAGCTAFDTVFVYVSDIEAFAGADQLSCPFFPVVLGCEETATGSFGPFAYSWTSTAGDVFDIPNPTVTPDVTTTYYLEATDTFGCIAYDTVTITIDYDTLSGLALISPADGEELGVGSVELVWSYPSGTTPVLFDVYLDGAALATGLTDTFYTIDSVGCGESHSWRVVASNICSHTLDYSCFADLPGDPDAVFYDTLTSSSFTFTTIPCAYPTATYLMPIDLNHDGLASTACECQEIRFLIMSMYGVYPDSVVLDVNGTEYYGYETEITFSGDTLIFTPPAPCFSDGEWVVATLLDVVDTLGGHLPEPVTDSFVVDLSPPDFSDEIPSDGSIIPAGATTISVDVFDTITGVNLDSAMMIVYVNGVVVDRIYSYSGSETFSSGDSVMVCAYAEDFPDYCPPNDTTFCWDFVVAAGLSVELGPDSAYCSTPERVVLTPDISGGEPPLEYRWFPGSLFEDSTALTGTAHPESSVWLHFEVSDSFGGYATDSMRVIISNLVLFPGEDQTSCPGVEVVLGCSTVVSGGVEPYNIIWFTADGDTFVEANPTVSPESTTVYYLEVTDSIGCVATDSVVIDIPFEPLSDFELISPPDSGGYIDPGDIILSWNAPTGTEPIFYDIYLDDSLIVSGIDSTNYAVVCSCGESHIWYVVARNFCSYSLDYLCYDGTTQDSTVFGSEVVSFDTFYFETTPCSNIQAEIITPRAGIISACVDQDVRIRVISENPIDESSIILGVDGIMYTVDSTELEFFADTLLVYTPDPLFDDGNVSVELVQIADVFGDTARSVLSWSFTMDTTPPYASLVSPSEGEIVTDYTPDVTLELGDSISGVDISQTSIYINTYEFPLADARITYSDDRVLFNTGELGIELGPDDTVEVCVTAADSPDTCGPNLLDTCFVFYTMPRIICAAYPKPFIPENPTNSYVQFTFPGQGFEEAEIFIYNLRNVEVRHIKVPASQSAKQLSRWDGRDDKGKLQKPGVYLYLIERGGKVICNGTVVLAR